MSTKLDQFIEEYERQLRVAVQNYPTEYAFPIEQVPLVVSRMKAAFERRSYNKDGKAIKATCKILNIPYTRKGIDAFFQGE
jgi:hypothetical protein